MAALALVLFVIYAVLAFGLRAIIHLRRTGSSGFKGISGRPGSLEWIAGVLFAMFLALLFVAPALQLAEVILPIVSLEGRLWRVLGFALFGVGLAATLLSQASMGTSWRIGVDEAERTNLVTGGPFAIVRNPIFSAMFVASLGLILLVPNMLALAGFAVLVAAVELQVRFVEEPYLLRTHGDRYRQYASRVGRFAPGIGRLGR
ncbi:methyltransferase family protein [Rubrobacter indicoceani]|uniref:methyltransferase family protein n=1 Tax=Rubrobacter indicoceani TaxID=2051957 RepID=UPI000E5B4990|nr:isoprenylcysteine carboxylmethyltransferase family protein [Rubrobacter indicoceani]